MPEQNKPVALERYRTLDAWRGLASLWVVMVHATTTTIPIRLPELSGHVLYAFSIWGTLGVPIFFVVSGYCICGSAYGLMGREGAGLAFARARFLRIYPPYLTACLVAAAMAVAAKLMLDRGTFQSSHLAGSLDAFRNPVFVLSTLTITQRWFHQGYLLVVMWTLCYEVMFYAIVLLVLVGCRLVGAGTRGLLLSLHAITVVSLLAYVFRNPLQFPFDGWPLFGMGVLGFDLVAGRRWKRLPLAALTPLAIVALVAARKPSVGEIGPTTFSVQLGLCLACMIALKALHPFDEAMYRSRLLRPIIWIGVFSYSLYLIHPLVMGAFLQLTRSHPPTAQTFIWYYWSQILLSIAAGYVFYRLVEGAQVNRARRARSVAALPSPPTGGNLMSAPFVAAEIPPMSS